MKGIWTDSVISVVRNLLHGTIRDKVRKTIHVIDGPYDGDTVDKTLCGKLVKDFSPPTTSVGQIWWDNFIRHEPMDSIEESFDPEQDNIRILFCKSCFNIARRNEMVILIEQDNRKQDKLVSLVK